MGTWIRDTVSTGALATAATTAAVAALGKLRNGSAAGPINAVSHILWGERDSDTDALDAKHTLVGAGLNAAAVTAWAALYELLMPRGKRPSFQRAMVVGGAVSTIAYITDYHVVPKRLTPGFEKRVSGASLFGIYAVLAFALAAGSLAREK